MCNCSGSCGCAPQSRVQDPLRCDPAPIPEITWSVLQLPAGSTPTVIVSGVPPVYHVQIGFPGAFSPTFGTNVVVNMIPNGDPASGTIDNTDPLNPILTLNIPTPLNGVDGKSPWSEMTANFTMPAIDGLATLTVADATFLELGSWIYMQGAGTFPPYGGWLVVAGIINPTQVFVRNPGVTDGVPVTGVPGNVVATTVVTPTGSPTQVIVSGRMGPAGLNGDAGPGLAPPIVYIVPVSPPVDDTQNLVIYFNAAPPSVPTIGQFYSWNGATYDAGPNFVGQGGTSTFTGVDDPNLVPPPGSKILDLYIQFIGSSAEYWRQTAPATWTTIGTVSTGGMSTTTTTHTVAGTLTIPAENFSTLVDANKDIDIAFDPTNYDGQGMWTVVIYNSDAGTIDFTAGTLLTSGIPTLPLTIPAGQSAVIVVRKYTTTGGALPLDAYVVEQAYVPA